MLASGGKEGGVADFSGVSGGVTDLAGGAGGMGGKARISLLGLKIGFEALDGTKGLEGGDVMSSGEAKGGLEGLLDGDCLGGSEGGASSVLVGDTDLTVFTLALELKESLEDVKLIFDSVFETGGGGGGGSKLNFVGRGGGGAAPNSYFFGIKGIEDLGGGGGGGKFEFSKLGFLFLVSVSW